MNECKLRIKQDENNNCENVTKLKQKRKEMNKE